MSIALASLVLLLPAYVHATNDWNSTCLTGVCSYDLVNATSQSTASGTLYLNGSTNAISDLTPAAGWTIIECDVNATAQDIRAVCTGDNSTCSHLYNNGAINTIVRLPESCGKMPFARIASEWTHDNQSLPEGLALPNGTVRGITLDLNFSQIPEAHHGPVQYYIQGASGVPTNVTTTPPVSDSDLSKRGLGSFFGGIIDKVKDGVNSILQDLSFNKEASTSKNVNIDKSLTILDLSQECSNEEYGVSFEAKIEVAAEVQANADVTFGVVAQGSIIPPSLDRFGVYSTFNADFEGTLTAEAAGQVSVDTGKKKLFEVGLPGLDFPGILTIGPSFQLLAEATATASGDASLSCGISYHGNGQLYFPPSSGSSFATFSSGDSPLKLSAARELSVQGSVVAHVIPSLVLGIEALSVADADVTLGLDAHAELDLSLAASNTESFNGCVGVKTGLAVQASADGQFFSFFKAGETINLWSKDWTIYDNCWGNKREHARAFIGPLLGLPKRELTCGTGNGQLESIADETVDPNSEDCDSTVTASASNVCSTKVTAEPKVRQDRTAWNRVLTTMLLLVCILICGAKRLQRASFAEPAGSRRRSPKGLFCVTYTAEGQSRELAQLSMTIQELSACWLNALVQAFIAPASEPSTRLQFHGELCCCLPEVPDAMSSVRDTPSELISVDRDRCSQKRKFALIRLTCYRSENSVHPSWTLQQRSAHPLALRISSSYTSSLVLLLAACVRAANDWNSACLSGVCSYDLVNSTSQNTASGTIYLNGSTSSISDLTPAAGWTIIECDVNATVQDIRAVCTGDNTTCSHLYNNGAVNTIVRLPENCGSMPFARIASEWTHDNQSLPEGLALPNGTVRGITLDLNFTQIPETHHGPVQYYIQGASGLPTNVTTTPPPLDSAFSKRGLFDFNKEASTSKKFTIDKTATILDVSQQCRAPGVGGTFDAKAKVSAQVKGNADVNFGVVAKGSVVPPKLDRFGVFSTFNADFSGSLTAEASGQANVDTGRKTILEIGLPGLDFPGVGPSFQLRAEATASAGGDASLTCGISYRGNGQLFFPPSGGSSFASFSPGSSALKLSAARGIAVQGQVTAHVIPSLVVGISALSVASADVTLALDASAELDLSLAASNTQNFNGCVDVKTGLNVQGTASGKFFNFFKAGETINLWQKNWEIYNQCVGRQTRPRARVHWPTPRSAEACTYLRFCKWTTCVDHGPDRYPKITVVARISSLHVLQVLRLECRATSERCLAHHLLGEQVFWPVERPDDGETLVIRVRVTGTEPFGAYMRVKFSRSISESSSRILPQRTPWKTSTTMNSNDLFSFLDDNAPEEPEPITNGHTEHQPMETEEQSLKQDAPLKRKAGAVEDTASHENGDVPMSDSRAEPETPSSKKPRMASPKPVVLDSVEIEAKREVAASAGLTGGVEAGSRLEIRHQVRHQVAVPPGYPYVPIANHVPPAKPAREYKFVLDPFQQVSVHAIQRNESVLVSAHTSAGKTVVAEYAIAQCLQNKQRALSNQKYRELLADFGDVGLMTGDVTINPTATCLVMTTEILRSMLYRGSEIMREVAWVIFDEIHYMRDKERGVVWEETIILLPHSVRYVFLSATIPNAMQFAEWICKSHEQPCHVVYTDFRPTPLQHYLFPAGGEGIYLVVNEKGEFREDNFTKAMGMLQDKQGDDPADPKAGRGRKGKSRKGGDKKGPSDIQKIIKMIMLKNYNPVIVFAFSKRECEALALTLSKSEFTSTDEQDMIGNIFTNAIENLAPDDRQLPQISNLLPLLKRGIGIHHGGLAS
ncbi:hypothetical protein NM688_g5348 [Phlebia brevispora]|uniref:Uncharacterized protein n=1 Tax=Phlebia brevispora TaxID=194682 RepID=A0ACC1SXF9_9APHY|nr:hypothetical protein NM688_g5348 [Phlebia brevispora]